MSDNLKSILAGGFKSFLNENDMELEFDQSPSKNSGHQLAGIVPPEEMDDEDEFGSDDDEFGSDEDEFGSDDDEFGSDEDEFGSDDDEFGSDDDEFGSDEDEFGSDGSDPDVEFGDENIDDEDEFGSDDMRESFSMIKSLLSEAKKKKIPLKKASKSVYHRDYKKTKNKPYRKYHPHGDQQNEGVIDYMRGVGAAGKEKLKQIPQQVRDVHNSGKQSSLKGELSNLTYKLAVSINKYLKLKNQGNVSEGAMDYLRGAKQETGKQLNRMAQPIRDIHAAGKSSSRQAEMNALSAEAKQIFSNIVRLLDKAQTNDKSQLLASVISPKIPLNIQRMILKNYKNTQPDPFRSAV